MDRRREGDMEGIIDGQMEKCRDGRLTDGGKER
jgi:hypothetical protein